MSVVTYNGVELPYALHTSFRQEAAYDDSNTDRIYTRYDITVQCLINENYLTLLDRTLLAAGVPKTRDPAAIMNAVREKLLTPRKALHYTVNGVDLIPLPQDSYAGTVDSRNGPLPQACEITQMTAVTFLLSYRVVAHYWEQSVIDGDRRPVVQNADGGAVLSNRWSETVTIDELDMSRRTRTGKAVIRSDNVAESLADQVRSTMAVVSVPSGFLRDGSSYTVSPDGLALLYTVVDKEVFKKPPPPAFRATGTYTESTGKMGVLRYGEADVRLDGGKETPQHQLVEAAIKVAAGKIFRNAGPSAGPDPNGELPFILLDARVQVGMYENWAQCTIRAQYTKSSRRVNGIAGFAGQDMTFVDGSDGGSDVGEYWPLYQDRGTAGLLLRAAAYYDPSLSPALGPAAQQTDDNPFTTLGDAQVQTDGATEVGGTPEPAEEEDE